MAGEDRPTTARGQVRPGFRQNLKCNKPTPPLKRVPALICLVDLDQTATHIPLRQCVEANGAGGWSSDDQKWPNEGGFEAMVQ
jgi:hypothetical protein